MQPIFEVHLDHFLWRWSTWEFFSIQPNLVQWCWLISIHLPIFIPQSCSLKKSSDSQYQPNHISCISGHQAISFAKQSGVPSWNIHGISLVDVQSIAAGVLATTDIFWPQNLASKRFLPHFLGIFIPSIPSSMHTSLLSRCERWPKEAPSRSRNARWSVFMAGNMINPINNANNWRANMGIVDSFGW